MEACLKSMANSEECILSVVDQDEAKRAKRRRRSPLSISMGHGQQYVIVSSTATVATTTIKRSSRFRGVSRHRWTGRYEAHLWDKESWNVTQKKKGKQVYLGAYDEEEAAARAYDLTAIKYWGTSAYTNFPICDYEKEVETMQNVTREEYLASLRRRSSGFAGGISKHRGVVRRHNNGRWEARIGRIFGNKYLYRGTYDTREEAAHAHDIAAIEYRGINAVTNFGLNSYIKWLGSANQNPAPFQVRGSFENDATNAYESNYMHAPKKDHELLTDPNSFAAMDHISSHKISEEKCTTPLRPGNKGSSPTALGLLLRSSMFKQLVEKNYSSESMLFINGQENNGKIQKKRLELCENISIIECNESNF